MSPSSHVLRNNIHLNSLCLAGTLIFSACLWLGSVANAIAEEPQSAIKAPLASRSLLLDIAVNQGRAIAVGERGHILVSCGTCSEWHQADVPVRSLLTAVHMFDANTAWAVGHDAVILRTDDGGENWQIQFRDPEQERPFLDVWFEDKQRGYAIGAYGLFMVTTDGGRHWQERQISEDDFHLNQISFSAEHGYLIAAEAGMVYHSMDAETWTQLESPYEGSYFAAASLANGQLLIAGLRGHLFSSGDAENWQPVETGSEALLTDIIPLRDGRVLITGMAGTLLLSEDGRQFTRIQKTDRRGIASVAELDDGSLLAVGEGGIRRLTLD